MDSSMGTRYAWGYIGISLNKGPVYNNHILRCSCTSNHYVGPAGILSGVEGSV